MWTVITSRRCCVRINVWFTSEKMSPIKDFHVVLHRLNAEGTFSSGDTLSGAVNFHLSSSTKVKSVSVKAKGEATVRWSEGSGDNKKTYHAHRRYFKLKKFLVEENAQGTVLPQGVHNFKFRLQIPQEDMPRCIKAPHGKIVYTIEAKISRSWRWPSRVYDEMDFVSKSFPYIDQAMCPLSGSVSKELGTFSKGQVQMSATVNRKACSPGDTFSAVAKISNSSSKEMKPKFSLVQRTVYRATSKTKTCDTTLLKMVGDTVLPNSEVAVSCQMKVPSDAIYSLHNCEILTVEYYMKVYLDISFAFDPEVLFPLVIVPSSFIASHTAEDMGPYPPGAPSFSDFPPSALPPSALPPSALPPPAFQPPAFPPPVFSVGPNPVPTASAPPLYPAPDPTRYTNIASGSYNQWPQPATAGGFSAAASTPSSEQHPSPPSALPQYQGDDLPSYSSLFLTSHDPLGRSDFDNQS